MEELNPFLLAGYRGPEYFCDREEETRRITSHVLNGVNTTLFSLRRMGKTGLIYHVFHTLQRKKQASCIYLDIYASQNLKEFTGQLAGAILKAFPEHKTIGKKFTLLLKSLRPVIHYDALTGEPEIKLDLAQPSQHEHSLASLFQFLDQHDTTILVALDEFQQIASYPEKNIEALLRSIIQPLKNVRFIFGGSSRHLLNEIFSDNKRPFFASTQPLFLTSIPKEKYTSFIELKLQSNKRKITPEALDFILTWTRGHTYYTQVVCNRLFASGIKNINLQEVQLLCSTLLNEQEPVFYQYRNLLTSVQWELLKAIAIEEKVYQPSSKKFMEKHPVGTPSNVQRALEALLTKEIIYSERDENGNYYSVYDCFLSRWLSR